MSKTQNSRPYDLRDRTLNFAKLVRSYVKNLRKTLSNIRHFGFRASSFGLSAQRLGYQFRNIHHFDAALLLFSESCRGQL